MTPTTKRPAFQFYPGDWRRDLGVRTSSIAARGLLIELMCIMHDGEPYGHLAVAGRGLKDDEAAAAVGMAVRDYRKLLKELDDKQVISRTPAGVIYSRRMVRDEDVRNARASGGAEGAEHGSKGAASGVKGGRPRKDKGGLITPLALSVEPPSRGSKEPPPSVAVAVSVSTALTPSNPDGLEGPPSGPEPPLAGAKAMLTGTEIQERELRAAALPHEIAALEHYAAQGFRPAIVGELHALASGMHVLRGSHPPYREANAADVMLALSEMASKGKSWDVSFFRGCVVRILNRPAPAPDAQERERQRLEKEIARTVPSVTESVKRHADLSPKEREEAARIRAEAMAHFKAEFYRNNHRAAVA